MKNENNCSEIFKIKKSGLELDFEFFTLNYIKTELEKNRIFVSKRSSSGSTK